MKKSEESSEVSNSEVKKKLSKTQKIMIFGFGMLSIAIVAAGILIYLALIKEEEPTASGNYVIDESNYEQVIGDMNEKLQNGMYEVTMNAVWNFDNGDSASSDAYVENASSNRTPVFFEVYLKDTDELIYTSTVLPVGTKLKELKLDKPLEKGTYDAICKYNLLDEEGNISSSVSINVTIAVAK